METSLLEGGSGSMKNNNRRRGVLSFISKIFFQAFTMTFLAEWGDRSQLTTIILGSREVSKLLR